MCFFSLLRTKRSGFGFGFGFGGGGWGGLGAAITAIDTLRVAAVTSGTLERAVNVTVKVCPPVPAGAVQLKAAVVGLPSRGCNTAPGGKRVARIMTVAAEVPGPTAASPKLTWRPTVTWKCAPSAGVGALQLTPGTAAGRAPDQRRLDADAGSARQNAAAPTSRTRKLDPIERGTLDDIWRTVETAPGRLPSES